MKRSLKKQIPAINDIRKVLAERSLVEYTQQAWKIIEPTTEYIHGWHIDAICEHLEAITSGELRNLIITMPPRFMKSILVSVMWPTWGWIRNPELRWLYSSYAETLSVRDSVKSRRIIQSSWYQNNWGNKYHLTSDQNVKSRYENNKTGYRIATSVGGSATGEGGDVVVVDDPHNVNEASSDKVREATVLWWDQVMSTRLNNPKTSSKVIVMQRIHENDLVGHVLRQGGYEHLCLPAEYEGKRKSYTSIGWEDPREKEGDLLWPERFGTQEIVEAKKRLGSIGYAGQFQQSPSPASGAILKREWWQYYRIPPVRFDMLIQSWDMAFKDTKTSAYVVGQVWGKVGPDKYLLDQVRDKMDFVATLNAFKALTAKWPKCTAKLIEDTANGPAVISSLKNHISGIIPVKPQGSKEARAYAISPEVESGHIWLPESAPWINDFVEETSKFPNSEYKDQTDALTQALNWFVDNSEGIDPFAQALASSLRVY